MAIHLTEKKLKDAVLLADKYYIDSLPSDSQISHEFSKEFLNKMQILVQQSKELNVKKSQGWRKRLVVGIAVILMFLSTTAMAVPPIREKIFEFVGDVYKQFTHIYFNSSENNSDIIDFRPSMPSYIPDGFSIVIEDFDRIVFLLYENGVDSISYKQILIKEASIQINTEDVTLEELEFSGLPARYYSNQGKQNLLWYDDEYLFMVSSTLERDTIFRIAESVKPVKE